MTGQESHASSERPQERRPARPRVEQLSLLAGRPWVMDERERAATLEGVAAARRVLREARERAGMAA